MSSKGLGPATTLAILEDTGHHGLLELCIVNQEQRCFGVSEVYGIDTTVGVVLLGEPQKVAILILKQLVSSHHMAVGTAQYLGILLASDSQSIIIDLFIKGTATSHDGSIAALQVAECLEDAYLASMSPVALISLIHVLDILHLVITQHGEAAGLLYLSEIVHISHGRHFSHILGPDSTTGRTALLTLHLSAVGTRELTCLHEGLEHLVRLTHGHVSVDGGHIEVTPVDTDAVTLLGQDGLLHGSCLHISDTILKSA